VFGSTKPQLAGMLSQPQQLVPLEGQEQGHDGPRQLAGVAHQMGHVEYPELVEYYSVA